MNNELQTTNYERKMRTGFTLIELVIAMSAALIVVLVVGTLLVSGQRSWARAFSYAYAKPQLDALGTHYNVRFLRQKIQQDGLQAL